MIINHNQDGAADSSVNSGKGIRAISWVMIISLMIFSFIDLTNDIWVVYLKGVGLKKTVKIQPAKIYQRNPLISQI